MDVANGLGGAGGGQCMATMCLEKTGAIHWRRGNEGWKKGEIKTLGGKKGGVEPIGLKM